MKPHDKIVITTAQLKARDYSILSTSDRLEIMQMIRETGYERNSLTNMVSDVLMTMMNFKLPYDHVTKLYFLLNMAMVPFTLMNAFGTYLDPADEYLMRLEVTKNGFSDECLAVK